MIEKISLFYRNIMLLLGADSRKIPFMLLLFLLTSMLDLVGIVLIGPYVSVISDVTQLPEGAYHQLTERLSLQVTRSDLVKFMSIGLVILFATKGMLAILINRRIWAYCFSVGAKISTTLLNSIQALSYEEYSQRNSSEYVQLVRHQSEQFSLVTLQALLRVTSESFVVAGICCLLLYNFGSKLLLFIGFVAFMILLYVKFFRLKIKSLSEEVNAESRKMIQYVNEAIDGFRENKILGTGGYFLGKFREVANNYANKYVISQVIVSSPRYLLEFIIVFGLVSIVILFDADADTSQSVIPMLAVFGLAAVRLLPSLNVITTSITQINYGQFGLNLLSSELSTLRDRHREVASGHIVTGFNFESLTLSEVSYKYPGQQKYVIDQVNLTIERGEAVAFVGSSGAGKSTLMQLVLGLVDPSVGAISVSGHRLADIRDVWWSQIAYIPQSIYLSDGSIRENIALGCDLNCIDEEKMKAAIARASLTDTVTAMPLGLDTLVGENGLRLSGGQRQRIALARAFYYSRSIIFMDEATSALDKETELEIMSEIKNLKGTITLIIISHSLDTVKHCDAIYRVSDGDIRKVVNS